jgi:XTP/dITP diphosphohydrolase
VETSWEEIKAAEKTGDAGPLRGVPAGMPPLARATKLASRLRKAGRQDVLDEATKGEDPGSRLLSLVAELTASGVDPDAALRGALRGLAERVGPPTEPT